MFIVFNDMITDIFSNIKLQPKVTIIYYKQKTKNCPYFHYTNLFCSAKKYYKFSTFFYFENSKEKRALTISN